MPHFTGMSHEKAVALNREEKFFAFVAFSAPAGEFESDMCIAAVHKLSPLFELFPLNEFSLYKRFSLSLPSSRLRWGDFHRTYSMRSFSPKRVADFGPLRSFAAQSVFSRKDRGQVFAFLDCHSFDGVNSSLFVLSVSSILPVSSDGHCGVEALDEILSLLRGFEAARPLYGGVHMMRFPDDPLKYLYSDKHVMFPTCSPMLGYLRLEQESSYRELQFAGDSVGLPDNVYWVTAVPRTSPLLKDYVWKSLSTISLASMPQFAAIHLPCSRNEVLVPTPETMIQYRQLADVLMRLKSNAAEVQRAGTCQ